MQSGAQDWDEAKVVMKLSQDNTDEIYGIIIICTLLTILTCIKHQFLINYDTLISLLPRMF